MGCALNIPGIMDVISPILHADHYDACRIAISVDVIYRNIGIYEVC